MGGKDKVFMSLKAARGTIVSTSFASLLLSLHKKCRTQQSEAATLEYVDCVARLVNILRFFPQLLSPDGRMGRDSHLKLVAQVGMVCLSLEQLLTGISSSDQEDAPAPAWGETSRATANLAQALSAHAHGLKPKASAALHAALSRIPPSLRASGHASQRRGEEDEEEDGGTRTEQGSTEELAPGVEGGGDGSAGGVAGGVGEASAGSGGHVGDHASAQGQKGCDLESKDMHVLAHTRKATCSACGRKSTLYCRDCLQELPVCEGYETDPRPQIKALLDEKAPRGLHVHIVVHTKTHPSNTTSLHAALLYPRDRVHVHAAGPRGPRGCGPGAAAQEALPASFDPSRSAVLFPSDDSTYVDELSREQLEALRAVIFIEATWECAAEVLSLPALRDVPRLKVRLSDSGGRGRGQYWKRAPVFSQGGGEQMLSTIEAIAVCVSQMCVSASCVSAGADGTEGESVAAARASQVSCVSASCVSAGPDGMEGESVAAARASQVSCVSASCVSAGPDGMEGESVAAARASQVSCMSSGEGRTEGDGAAGGSEGVLGVGGGVGSEIERGLTFYFRQEALKRKRAFEQHSLMLPVV